MSTESESDRLADIEHRLRLAESEALPDEDRVRRLKAAYHIGRFMEVLGLDVDGEHLTRTPERVANSRIDEIFRGVKEDPRRHLRRTFTPPDHEGDAGFVIVDGITIKSMCAHHFLPFRGECHIGYIPQEKLVGLSKLARVADGYARRPQVQENLTNEIADAIHEELNPLATIVLIEAEHECMSIRGVEEPRSTTRTSALRGKAREADHIKNEFFEIVSNGGRR